MYDERARKEVIIMLYIVRALVFLLETALACAGVDLTLGDAPVAPETWTLVGTTDVVQVWVVTLKLSRGSGPTQQTLWTGYWNATGA
jgi:hypothetical protein